MVDKRFHIHIICAPDDQINILDGLSLFFESHAFLTRDLLSTSNEANSYSRRCIDSCDYVIMLVGDSYGALNKTGVSQLHLSYIYAKTKAKPILTLLKLHNDADNTQTHSRQLIDFTRMVESQNSQDIYYYDDDVQMQTFFDPAYRKFIKDHQGIGWIKAEATINKPSSPTKTTNAFKVAPESTKNTVNDADIDSYIHSSTFSPDDDYSVNLDVEIMINFSTNAYSGGNLKTVSLMAPLTWRQVLQTINDNVSPMTVATFQKTINNLIHQLALSLAQSEISADIHAISRTQVSSVDLQWIQSQMKQFGWLKQSDNEASTRSKQAKNELLELTELAKQKLTAR